MATTDETIKLGLVLFIMFLVCVSIGLTVVFGLRAINKVNKKAKLEGFNTTTGSKPTTLNTDNMTTIQSVLPVDQLDSMFARIEEMKTEVRTRVSQALPRGLICMWSGQLPAPNGWALCDGTNKTPDLSGKFILGASPAVNINIGDKNDSGLNYHDEFPSVTLRENNLPPHAHEIPAFRVMKGNTALKVRNAKKGSGQPFYQYASLAHKYRPNDTIGKNPGPIPKSDGTLVNETTNQPVQIPKVPYYALAYIMYLGLEA